MNNITCSGFITKKGIEMREYNGSSLATFQFLSRLSSGKSRVLYSCTVWGKRGEVINNYANAGQKITVNGDVKDVRVLPAKDDGDPLPCIEITVGDFDLPPKTETSPQRSSDSPF